MENLKNLLSIYKMYSKEIVSLKIIALVTINTWLLVIFWKVLLIDNVNIIGNNVALTKMNTMLQPLLMYLGLDVLSPNTLKMVIITLIIITSNLMVLNFNGMIGLIITLGIARYGYKMYTNYLINLENMVAKPVPILKTEIKEKVMEQAPIIINNGGGGSNWMMWTALGIGLIVCVGLLVWSHNTNLNEISNVNSTLGDLNTATKSGLSNMDEKVTRIDQQINSLENANGKINKDLTELTKYTNEKINILEENYTKFGKEILKIEENNTSSLKTIVEKTTNISTEAQGFLKDVSQSSTVSDALFVSIAKLYEGFTLLEEKTKVVETRLDSLTGATTPRSGGIFNKLSNIELSNIVKKNNNDNL